jgi:hypothetical protein
MPNLLWPERWGPAVYWWCLVRYAVWAADRAWRRYARAEQYLTDVTARAARYLKEAD